MTRLILIRHGQSLANADHLFAGHSDFDLSDFGKLQAELAARYLRKNEAIDRIYASDLLRAYHTACPIGDAFGLPITKDRELREIFAGKWEGLPFREIAERYPDEMATWNDDYSRARPVGGESTAEVYHRVVPHIRALAEQNDGKCILLASHATVLRAFDAHAQGYSAEETGKISFCYNAAINIYSYDDGKVTPIRTNIIDHLGDYTSHLPTSINA